MHILRQAVSSSLLASTPKLRTLPYSGTLLRIRSAVIAARQHDTAKSFGSSSRPPDTSARVLLHVTRAKAKLRDMDGNEVVIRSPKRQRKDAQPTSSANQGTPGGTTNLDTSSVLQFAAALPASLGKPPVSPSQLPPSPPHPVPSRSSPAVTIAPARSPSPGTTNRPSPIQSDPVATHALRSPQQPPRSNSVAAPPNTGSPSADAQKPQASGPQQHHHHHQGNAQHQTRGGSDQGSGQAKPGKHELSKKDYKKLRAASITPLHEAVKVGDLKSAMTTFNTALAEGQKLPPAIYSSLLYLACGSESWEKHARGLPVSSTDDGIEALSKDAMVAAVDEILAAMQAANMPYENNAYLSLARFEAIRGDADKALFWANECGRSGKQLQLRLFHPALVSYCLREDVERVMHVDALITAAKLDLSEYEYARLLEVIAKAGTYAQMKSVLARMQSDLTSLTPPTLSHIQDFFATAASQQAFLPQDQGGCSSVAGAGSRWESAMVDVDAAGQCEMAGEPLKLVDLEEAEWDPFANAIADLARSNMKVSQEFDAYVDWYERNGPYDILIDGANVAFYGQNKADGSGGFSWPQIQSMCSLLKQRYPDRKILLMLHKKRVYDIEGRRKEVQSFLDVLKEEKSFYYAPPGSNDDWYWMYATVRAKGRGLLVSNDEMRDHIFSLFRPKHFLKWKERHIARFCFNSTAKFELLLPSVYTSCVQQLSNGTWMFPSSQDGQWLCVKPAVGQ